MFALRIVVTLLTCPALKERNFHLAFRTPQHKGHPHPVLSRSTPEFFRCSPKVPANRDHSSRSEWLLSGNQLVEAWEAKEARLRLALAAVCAIALIVRKP
jgi:hypothetical protein